MIRVVKTYLSIARRSTVSETAERLMDLAEAHIRNAGYGGFSFRDLAAEIGIKSASVHHHFPTKATMAAAVARRYGDRFLATVARRPNESAGDAISVYRSAFREALHRPGLTSGIGTQLPTQDTGASVGDRRHIMAEIAVELEIARLDPGCGQGLDDIGRDLWWKQRVGAAQDVEHLGFDPREIPAWCRSRARRGAI